MWYEYSAAMKGEKGDHIDLEEEVFGSTILCTARNDAYIFAALNCLGFEEAHGEHRAKKYLKNLQEYRSIAMAQITQEI